MQADLDNGYTRIANEILEALARLDLSGREFRVAITVMRKTYGFHKKVDWIGREQIAEITEISSENVSRMVTMLVTKKVLLQEGTGNVKKLGINTNLSDWNRVESDTIDVSKQHDPELTIVSNPTAARVESDMGRVENDTVSCQKRQTQKKKETITKETITKEIVAGASRGCRLAYTSIPDDWKTWASEEGHKNPDREFSVFRDYWIAKPGHGGVKTDWLATWRNWIRRSLQDRQTGPPAKRHNDFENRDYTAGVTSDGTF